MTNYHDRERLWSLIIDAIDNLEQVARARELTNIIGDINVKSSKTEQDWEKVQILLESYEINRDKFFRRCFIKFKRIGSNYDRFNLVGYKINIKLI